MEPRRALDAQNGSVLEGLDWRPVVVDSHHFNEDPHIRQKFYSDPQ
jgi:hypothetical protein